MKAADERKSVSSKVPNKYGIGFSNTVRVRAFLRPHTENIVLWMRLKLSVKWRIISLRASLECYNTSLNLVGFISCSLHLYDSDSLSVK